MKSMTGFGKATTENEYYQLDVEIKSVNQRFLDLQFRLPKEANPYELVMRQIIKETLQRGRVEIYINMKYTAVNNKEVVVHWSLIDQLMNQLQTEASKRYPDTKLDVSRQLAQLLNNPDYVEVIEKRAEEPLLESLLIEAVTTAIGRLDDSRRQEGEKIRQVLAVYATKCRTLVEILASFVSVYEQEYRQRLETKLSEWVGEQIEESRLLTEVAILIEKGDIHEELDRLTIHLDKLEELLVQEVPVGRELDFLIQEMNREVNTIGSKSSPIEIKNNVVQLKTILEKIREQIQNIE